MTFNRHSYQFIISGCFFLLGIVSTIQAQDITLPPVSDTYAITGATIIQSPDRKIENGIVVIRNGIIEAVGTQVTIPLDAIIIKADSLYVYAGFIDGLSRVAVRKENGNQQESVLNPGSPPPTVAGITPQIEVRDLLDKSSHLIAELRSVGFTSSHVVPYGVFLPGKGSVIEMGGNSNDDLVLKRNVSLYSELSFTKMVYPSTTYGVLAKWRELYKQAELAKAYQTLYTSNAKGLTRPESNRILEAFYPVIDNNVSVFFKAESALDICRVLKLKEDLKIKSFVIGGIKEGWDLTDKIKASGAAVFVSLGLEDHRKMTKEDSLSDLTTEMKNLLQRQDEFRQKQTSLPGLYEKAGIPFGFTTLDVKNKCVLQNLRKMIRAGLSEEGALAALTTSPAQIFGIDDRLGTIDKGKIANLIISNKPIFDEKACLQWIFVEGTLYKETKKNWPKENKTLKGIEGSWSMVTETPQGKVDLKVIFTKDDDKYSGKISGGKLLETTRLTSVKREEDKLTFTYSVTFGDGSSVEVIIMGKLSGVHFKGDMIVGKYGSYLIEGSKDPESKL